MYEFVLWFSIWWIVVSWLCAYIVHQSEKKNISCSKEKFEDLYYEIIDLSESMSAILFPNKVYDFESDYIKD